MVVKIIAFFNEIPKIIKQSKYFFLVKEELFDVSFFFFFSINVLALIVIIFPMEYRILSHLRHGQASRIPRKVLPILVHN